MKSLLATIQKTIKSLKHLPPEAFTPGVGLTIEAQKAFLYGGPDFTIDKIKEALRHSFYEGIQPFRYEPFNKTWYSPPINRAGTPPDPWGLVYVPREVRGRVDEYFDAKLEASIAQAQKNLEIPTHRMAQSPEQQTQALRNLIYRYNGFGSLERDMLNKTHEMNPEDAKKLISEHCCIELHKQILDLSLDSMAMTPLPKLFWPSDLAGTPSDVASKLSELALHKHKVGSSEACDILLNNEDFGARLRDLIDSLSPKVESIKPSSHSNKSSLSI